MCGARLSVLLGLLGLACVVPMGRGADAEAEQGFTVYTVQEGDTLQALAEKFMGGSEFVDELLGYNRIENPARVRTGSLLAIPTQVRTQAIDALSRAESAMASAVAAQAEVYAADEFTDAQSTIREARADRERGRYANAAALAELGSRKASEAKRLADERAPIQQEAKLTFVQGPAEVSADAGATWSAAQVGATLPVRGQVRTGAGARVEVTLAEGSIIQVAQVSTFSLENFLLDRRTGHRNSKLKVVLGSILGKVEPRKVESSVFDIDTGGASIAIRGTELRVGAETGATRLSVLEGSTLMAASGGSVEVPQNFGSYAEAGRPPAQPLELFPPPGQLVPREALHVTADQTPGFGWHPVYNKRVAGYRLEIASDLAFNAIVQDHRIPEVAMAADVLPEGDYFWRVSTVDRYGLEGPSSRVRQLRIQKNYEVAIQPTAPLLDQDGQKLARLDTAYQVRPARKDTSIAQMEYSLDGSTYLPATEQIRFSEGGDYHLRVRGRGPDGAAGEPQELKVRVDGTPPEVSASVLPPRTAAHLGEVVLLQLAASDAQGVDRIEVSLDGERFVEYVQPLVFSALDSARVFFHAYDVLGNRSETQTIELTGR